MKLLSLKYSHTVDNERINKAEFSNGTVWYSTDTQKNMRKTIKTELSYGQGIPRFIVAVTYSNTTPESTEYGDYAETGYLQKEALYSLKQVLSKVSDFGPIENFCKTSTNQSLYSSSGYTIDYSTCTDLYECLHISGPKKAMLRLNRILKNKLP